MDKREFINSELNEVVILDWLAEECADLIKNTLMLSRILQANSDTSKIHAEIAADISAKLARIIAAFHMCRLKSDDFATDRELSSLEEEKLSEWAQRLGYRDESTKTLKEILLELIPGIYLTSDGVPRICPDCVWRGFEEDCNGDCAACWNRPASLIPEYKEDSDDTV